MQYLVSLNAAQYSFRSAGCGDALVMLHGFTGSARSWDEHIPVFSQQYEVITPDLLGHGDTAAPQTPERCQIERAAADLIALLDALRLERAHLLGYSMGGRLALYVAAHYSDRIQSLILESASPGLRTEEDRAARRQQDNALADRIEQEGVAWFVDYWERLPLWDSQRRTLSAEAKQALRAERLRHTSHGLANSLRGMGTGAQPSLWENLRMLTVPVQLIVGERDAKFTNINQEMATLLPDVRLDIVPDAGHAVHLEQPKAFQQIVTAFLT